MKNCAASGFFKEIDYMLAYENECKMKAGTTTAYHLSVKVDLF